MDATASPAPSVTVPTLRGINWFPVAVFALVWIELISRLRFEWSINPQYGYGWTVPFLAAYIFWRRSENAPAPSAPDHRILAGLLIILAAAFLIPVRLIQEANPDWRLLSWAMAVSVGVITACGIYLSGGRPWVRHFAFPILFFFVAVPWPTNLEQFVIQGLMRIDALINVEILNTIGIPAVQLGNVIEVGSGFVGIDEACTGIRSLQATFMVSLFLGEFYEFAVWRRIILVVAGCDPGFLLQSGAHISPGLRRRRAWLRDDQELARPGGTHDSHGLPARPLGIEHASARQRPGRTAGSPITANLPRATSGPRQPSGPDPYCRSGHPNLVSRP